MNRPKYIHQKRSTLKAQLTNFEKILADGRVDDANMRMRLKRITELFHAYEDLHDELATLEPTDEHLDEFSDIQDRYYAIASKFESSSQASTSRAVDLNATSIPIDNNTRRIKLPVAELPKFDGDIEKWLSYKNTFVTMIDSRQDITNLQKFLYLKNSLQGDALNKISIYNVSEENYETAWKLLKDSYERKRILITKHLDAIIELPHQSKATHKGLTGLVDDMRQHVNMLASLDVNPDQHLLIRIIERALPTNIRVKWEETLNLDVLPTLDQLYKFISETAFRIFALEHDASRSRTESGNKRSASRGGTPSFKARKDDSGARALVTNTYSNCSLCKKERHFLYRCPEFAKLTMPRRWDFVRKSKICFNCLRSHDGRCRLPPCKICNKSRNTLLHNHLAESRSSKQDAAKVEIESSPKQSSAAPFVSD
ncbi:PREDICTED: uncharacterized protein LOC105570787 [Vollenhovia emeryi]|uniref:uncharacterized protein LOC105570787 n=1 Tax=Vollenhovia emeryi TaxID=411798 RepID=UPI0005F474C6|nr:PREDICTED: uncharacterized protein LOC105570787 [Vollenhovia emeryi]